MKLPTNRERADWASIALDTYAETVNTPDEERELVLSGLLCDMMHYCEVEEIDWYQCVWLGHSITTGRNRQKN